LKESKTVSCNFLMCGINAILDLNSRYSRDENLIMIQKMNHRILHRGPDANCSEAINDHIYFGHLRLSIIDLSERGNQPMHKSNCVITYNGEIYNYLEIRKELEGMGHHFVTESDTEVVIEAYLEWGVDALSRFNGMWAFVLYDQDANLLFISRDRFGKKPLYYTNHNGVYYFSSELKAIAEVRKFKVNTAIAYAYLAFGWQEQSHETMVDGVFHFPKGSYAFVGRGLTEEISIESYYDVKKKEPLRSGDLSFEDAKNEIRQLVMDSVALRLRSDVDVAFALSGGIDSSIITAVAAILKGKFPSQNTKLKTFSSVFTSAEMREYNEKDYIDAVLKKIPSLNPHFISPDVSKFISGMDQLLYIQDEPFYSAGMYAQQAVFKLIHENGVRVSLDGQGVDEAIGGYTSYNSIYLHQLKEQRSLLFLKEMIGFAYYYPDLFKGLLSQRFSRGKAEQNILGNRFLKGGIGVQIPEIQGYRQNCIFQIEKLYLPALLHHQDRNSMAYGVESRSPFLDYRIVEFFLALPVEYKIHNGKRKYILREAFKDVLPNEVYARYGKLGFPAPLAVWMKDNHTAFRALIQQACESGVADSAAVLAFDKQRQVGYKDYLKFIRLIYFDRWMKIYNVED